MEFQKSLLSRLKEVYLEGTFNDITIQCKNGARKIPSFLLFAISPLFRQDHFWTGVILPDASLQDLEEFMNNALSHGSEGTRGCETLVHLLESFTSSSVRKNNKRVAKLQAQRCSSPKSQYYYHVKKKIIDTPRAETNYGLRPLRKKIKFTDEVSEEENGEGETGLELENGSDYEPPFHDEEEEEEDEEEEEIQEEEDIESLEKIKRNNDLSDEDQTSSSQDDDDEDDLYEEYNLLMIESEGEDDDLYEYHLSSHQSCLENLDEEDITLVTVKLNEEGQIQMIDQVSDPENCALVQNVGNLLSDGSNEKNTKEDSSKNDYLENVTTHRLLLKCFSCPEHFMSLCELRYHSAKFHPDGSFFRLPMGHPHAKCPSCVDLFSSYQALIADNKDLQMKDICFCCPHCRRRFMGRINALRSHLKEEHYELTEEKKAGPPLHYHPVLIRGDIKSLICDFCKEPFESTKLVNRHLLTCSSNYIGVSPGVFCRNCGKTFSQLRSLESHCMNIHRRKIICNRSKMLFCSLCPAARHTESALRKHVSKQHRELSLSSIHEGCEPCTLLTESFLNSKHLSRELMFKCPHCKMLFPTYHNGPMRYIYNHVNRFHCDPEINKFTLDHFDKTLFRVHLKGEVGAYVCDFCSEKMDSRLDFNDHISACPLSTITCRPRYVCEFCGFVSGTSRSLRLHVTSTHSEISKSRLVGQPSPQKSTREKITKKSSHHKYTSCPHCGRLKKGASLKTHMKRCGLTSIKIKCTDCDMDFKHVEDMQAHSLIHYGQVTCPIHNILFKNESEIYHHVNIAGANNSPRLECCMCSRQFLYMCNFMQHLRRHLKISPYRCSICQKSVQSYASLRHHVRRMHIEDSLNKHFSCEHCQKEFTTKGHLKEHIAGVHERYNNVHCPVCHKSFNTQKRMKKHLFATHKEMADQFRSHSKVEIFSSSSIKT